MAIHKPQNKIPKANKKKTNDVKTFLANIIILFLIKPNHQFWFIFIIVQWFCVLNSLNSGIKFQRNFRVELILGKMHRPISIRSRSGLLHVVFFTGKFKTFLLSPACIAFYSSSSHSLIVLALFSFPFHNFPFHFNRQS